MAVVLIVQKAKIRYSWGFIPLKILPPHGVRHKRVRLGIYSIKQVKISYNCEFISLKKLKEGTAEDFVH